MSSITPDPLFMGLTRPAMMLGVAFDFVILNGFGCMLMFVLSQSLFILLVLMPVLHGVFYILSAKEPLMIKLFTVKMSKCNNCPNKIFHGNVNSYDPFK